MTAPLDLYLERGDITPAAFAAGDRFRRCWQDTGFAESVIKTGDGEGRIPLDLRPATELQSRSRDELKEMINNLGRHVARVLGSLLILEMDAEAVGNDQFDYAKSAEVAGMTMIRMALASLAHWYGIDQT